MISLNRGLARLIFILVFLIPIAWYLILQLFGDNSFSLELKQPLNDCFQPKGITIVRTSDSISLAKRNYLNRVKYAIDRNSISFQEMDAEFFNCINQPDVDLVLLNEEGLWGGYVLSREGVDLLLTELDILILQNLYGEGAYR